MNEKDKSRKDVLLGLMMGGIALAIVAFFFYMAEVKSICERSLTENGEVILMFAESSERTYSMDGEIKVCTKFSTEKYGERIVVETCAYNKVVPLGMPVYVLYSFECDNCASIIFDSVVYYKGYRFHSKPLDSYVYEYVINEDR